MKTLITIFLIFVLSINLQAQNSNSTKDTISNTGKIWGLAFGDYYYKTGGDSLGNQLQYTPYKKDYNALDFRRIFLGYDYNFSKKFFSSVVLAFEGSDALSNNKRTFFIKDAYIRWNEIFKNSNLTFGIISTPGHSVAVEPFWGYRSVEKTIMDQRNILGTRDLGVMLNGTFDSDKNYGYYFMIGDGSGASIENDKYKKFYGNLFAKFMDKKFMLDIYCDYQDLNPNQSNTTFDGFLGYKTDAFTAGVEYFFQYQKNAFAGLTTGFGPDNVPSGLSIFTSGKMYKELIKFYARYDFYNPNSKNSSTGFNENFVTAGLDFMVHPKVHIMPNIWLNAYSKKTDQISGLYTQVVPRITFFYDYR